MDKVNKDTGDQTPSMPETPRALHQPKELPVDDDNCVPAGLPPLELTAPLRNFPDNTAGTSANDLQSKYAEYTPTQLVELNQKLLDDSVQERVLIDHVTSMSGLRSEYEKGNDAFVHQIDWLITKGFRSIRRTRGDGDCFYRSLAFAYLESVITSPDLEFTVASILSMLESTKALLEQAGMQPLVYEDFYDEFVMLVQGMVDPKLDVLNPKEKRAMLRAKLLAAFQKLESSNSIVMYLRLLTSTQIRLHFEDYEGFIVHPDTQEPLDVDTFCANYVEPLGKEADNVVIEALCEALRLNLDVAYLNGSKSHEVDFIQIRHDSPSAPPLTLLYRPGHYDVLPSRKLVAPVVGTASRK